MVITVTAKDIRDGNRMFPETCPVALAVRRETGQPFIVGARHVWLKSRRYCLPKKAQTSILDFDEGRKMKPFSFELNLEGGGECG